MIDLTTAFIGLGMVALCILPIVYFHLAQKSKKKKFVKSFLSHAQEQQLIVSPYDVWGIYHAIGLDAKAHKLLYYKDGAVQEQKVLVNLQDVAKCRVNNVKVALNKDQVIDRLDLVFTFHNARTPEKALSFYSKEEGTSLFGELQLIEKWKTIVSSNLEARKKQTLA